MKGLFEGHKIILKPLSVFASIAVLYLFNSSALSSGEFWTPLFSIYLGTEGMFMPDIEVAERLFKFLLNIL